MAIAAIKITPEAVMMILRLKPDAYVPMEWLWKVFEFNY